MRHGTIDVRRGTTSALGVAVAAVLLVGCPYVPDGPPFIPDDPSGDPQTDYDRGFAAGFALDDWYWDGYLDGYYTISFGPIYYDDSGIPYIESPPYTAGYWDGVWYAYNDGYFVDYHYAFIIGFSEGYDNAYWPDYLSFLASDVHIEYLHGGWIDGYNDGYSEGRVFGANDYEQGLPFDWLDALRAYEDNVDLYFEEVDVGTGIWGPVILYEYGVNPHEAKRRPPASSGAEPAAFTVRTAAGAAKSGDGSWDLYRPFRADAKAELEATPEASARDSSRSLRLSTTWYERITQYRAGEAAKTRIGTLRDRVVDAPLVSSRE